MNQLVYEISVEARKTKMNISIVDLPEISIIGKEGFCTEEANIVQDLWKQANENFDEVLGLGRKEKKLHLEIGRFR